MNHPRPPINLAPLFAYHQNHHHMMPGIIVLLVLGVVSLDMNFIVSGYLVSTFSRAGVHVDVSLGGLNFDDIEAHPRAFLHVVTRPFHAAALMVTTPFPVFIDVMSWLVKGHHDRLTRTHVRALDRTLIMLGGDFVDLITHTLGYYCLKVPWGTYHGPSLCQR
jgi:hypothetical protein